jgi:hypothetical protein
VDVFDVTTITVEQFIFDGLIEGVTLLLALAVVWYPIGAVRRWAKEMFGG